MENDIFSDGSSSETDHVHSKGNFHGCYLLVSKNPKCTGKTYIGYTVNPNRRIKQHNNGFLSGGAKKTSGRGPWDMILIIHGFPSDIAALQFEWAWQHPLKSRHIAQSSVCRKKYKESFLEHKLRIVAQMLNVPPWSRLPLTIRWLKQEYEVPFDPHLQPPLHMPIAYGLIDIKSTTPTSNDLTGESAGKIFPHNCGLCHKTLKRHASPSTPSTVTCYHPGCTMASHITCLAEVLCEQHQIIPVSGDCPDCKQNLLWGELIRRIKQQELQQQQPESVSVTQPQPQPSQVVKTSRPRGRPPKKKRAIPTQQHWSKELNLT